MLGLRKDIGKLEVKALGITLKPDSSQKKFLQALKHKPKLKGLIIELSPAELKEREGDIKAKEVKSN